LLNGKTLSTSGGPGRYFFKYGPTATYGHETPGSEIPFAANQLTAVGEPINGLKVGTTYHFALCAEDGENPGDAFCSRDQTFTTDADPNLTGEWVYASNPVEPPSISFVRYPSCHTAADGTVTLEYTASGWAGGPFEGTFEENGVITTAAHQRPSDDRLLALTASFSINGGQVTGTRELVTPKPDEFQTATCTGNERGHGPLVFIRDVSLRYTAEIHTAAGDHQDQGNVTFNLTDIGTTINVGNVDGTFTSDAEQPASSR
jgi:hypothetical protein